MPVGFVEPRTFCGIPLQHCSNQGGVSQHVSIREDRFAKQREASQVSEGRLLAGIEITQWDRNSWKHQAWSLGEQIGWELWEHTTRQYFR